MWLHRPRDICHEAFIGLWKNKQQVQGREEASFGDMDWSLVPAVEKLPLSSHHWW